MTELYYPLRSLREGHWFKLICGASFQHLPAVRNLTLAYALAGADCVDVAADPAVISAAKTALDVAEGLGDAAQVRGFGSRCRPLLMVSLNDAEDPHFRKAAFDSDLCPQECPRPCEAICPAQAIVFKARREDQGAGELGEVPNLERDFSGVIDQRCYGCGRCLPVCPSQLIYTRSYVSAPEAIAELVLQAGVDALEIHTQVGNFTDFLRLWRAIAPWRNQLKLIAISCPDGVGLTDYLRSLHDLIAPLPCPLIWQTDGRPMSGDIGIGATRAAVKLAQKVLATGLPGYVQLAGGTNHHTVAKLKAAGLLAPSPKLTVAGVAYGSYARVLLSPLLDEVEKFNGQDIVVKQKWPQDFPLGHLEAEPGRLWQAVATAYSLVSQLKLPHKIAASNAPLSPTV